MKIVFIGMGKMDLPIAMRLVAVDRDLCGDDLSDERCELSVAQCPRMPTSIAETIVGAEVAISSMPNDAALLGAIPEILAAASMGLMFIAMSTV
jgi:3-hydroxyisobutyrate dehydrogenase-like beta-hydroxyacid dehydrogenase